MSASGEAAPQTAGVPLSPEAIDHALYVVGSHPLRVLALSVYANTSEDGARPSEVSHRINGKRVEAGGQPISHGHRIVEGMRLAGYLETTSEEEEGNNAKLRITELGGLALAPAGMAALYERRHPELSLPEFFGNVRHIGDGELSLGPARRWRILTQLVENPQGLPAKVLTNNEPAASTVLHLLREAGIIGVRDKHDASERTFVIAKPSRRHAVRTLGSDVRPEMLAFHIAVTRLAPQIGEREVNGADLLEATLRVNPLLDPMQIWTVFMTNPPTYIRTVDTDEFGGKKFSSNYRINPELRGAAEDIVHSLQQIKRNRGVWDDAAEYARDLITDPQEVFYLTTKAARRSRTISADDKLTSAELIAQMIPAGGIDENALLRAVTHRRKMSRDTFYSYVAQMPGVLVERQPRGRGDSRRVKGWVTNWERTFPSDWRRRGHCLDDPELFFPIGAVGLSATQTESAKQVCRGCPVRPACLKTATDSPEEGVWGGFSEDERRHLPLAVHGALGQVTIKR